MPKNLHKVVLDSSALISLAHGEILDLVLSEFEVTVSRQVLEELEETADYEDADGKAANRVLKDRDSLTIEKVDSEAVEELLTSRVHSGEASCVLLAQEEEIEAMISDDFDAMNQLEFYSHKFNFQLGLCPVLIQTLVKRKKLTRNQGREIFDRIARKRGWFGRQIYEYGKKML